MATRGRLRVVVADDSLTVRRHLVEVLGADPGIEVVGDCGDGLAAVELCARLRPDVITLDMAMPGLNGLQATERIMAFHPTPILIVSASGNRGDLLRSIDALAAGAIDAFDKPGGDVTVAPDWQARLIARVKLVARITPITHPRARLAARPETAATAYPTRRPVSLVAIGGSTGAPGALQRILAGLPSSFPLAILVVVHLGKPFGNALAEWLAGHCALPVREARDGEPLPAPGAPAVLIAPADRHLVVTEGRLRLDQGPERHFCRPSVDVLFESLAVSHGPRLCAALLTGMGRDGAAGLLAVRAAGGRTIAQDEASSIVYGMPGEAARIGAAERILPLDRIAAAIAGEAAAAEHA